MKITCTKERLLEGISIAEKISGKNLTLSVLNGVLLEATGKQFFIKATNLELGVEITIPADVEKEGKIVVPGSVLHGTLGAMFGVSPVTLKEINGNLTVLSPEGGATIKGQAVEDFPLIPKLTNGQTFILPTEHLIRGIRSVVYSASVSSIKPEQTSICIYQEDRGLVFTATDSFRLAEKKIAVSATIPEFDSILIPARNTVEILRVLEQSKNETVEIRLLRSQIAFKVDGVYLTSRLVDGVFPDYRQVIPKNFVTEAVVLKQDFVQVLKKLAIFADKSNQISMHLSPSEKTFILEARNADVGESRDTLRGSVTGDPLDINFNYRYIVDCFQSIGSDSVTLSFGGIGRPLAIRGVSDASFLYLAMPMNK